MVRVAWRGVYPACLTQFHSDSEYSMDINKTLEHIDGLLSDGVDGLVMLGTCGENNSLETPEKLELLSATVARVNGRVPVLTGVSEFTTQRAINFVAGADKAGVDGLMVLPAMAYSSDPRETVAHFKAVALSTALPIMIYNNPVSYRVDVTLPIVEQLADIENIVCIKESSNDPRRITDLINAFGDRFVLFAGVDDLAFESLLLGATGWVSGLVNAFPKENKLMWDLLQDGRVQEALQVYRWYTPLLRLDTVPKLVQLIKLVCAKMGYGNERCRPPRLPLVGSERKETLKILEAALERRPLPGQYYPLVNA
jgi:1-pyrroline-4-hydroxy-2-carboxylate deaminase